MVNTNVFFLKNNLFSYFFLFQFILLFLFLKAPKLAPPKLAHVVLLIELSLVTDCNLQSQFSSVTVYSFITSSNSLKICRKSAIWIYDTSRPFQLKEIANSETPRLYLSASMLFPQNPKFRSCLVNIINNALCSGHRHWDRLFLWICWKYISFQWTLTYPWGF